MMLKKTNSQSLLSIIRNSFILFLLLASIGCSNQFKLDKKFPFVFKESYYQSWVAGVRGGGSGITIFLTLEQGAANSSLQIEGIYFKEKYCKLKNKGENKYLGNIVTDQNQKTTILESSPSTDEKETKKIPFVLRGNEAVLVYLENKKKKYAKVTLYKKEMEALPM